MNHLKEYVAKVLGCTLSISDVRKQDLDRLPFHINAAFRFHQTKLLDRDVIIAEATDASIVTTKQVSTQFQIVRKILERPVVLLATLIPAVTRKRLIEKGVDFIVPDKQLFLPSLLVDMRETFQRPNVQTGRMLPSAQVIVLYKILHRSEKLEQLSFKELAERLQYSPMAITKAVRNLVYHQLCEVSGGKAKYLHFHFSVPELWNRASPLFVAPVSKRLYLDVLPRGLSFLKSSFSALPDYSDVSESGQEYVALYMGLFHGLPNKEKLVGMNDREGRYCVELWKYDPRILTGTSSTVRSVDPLSLYLSLRSNQDERIETALDDIIRRHIW